MSTGVANIRKQAYVLRVYSVLAFLSFAVFGSLHLFVEGNKVIGYCELAGALAVAANLALLRLSRNARVARWCLLATVIVLLFVMLATGGTEGTGIFWFFMFPVMAFFLAGAREGVFWVVLLALVLLVSWFAGQTGWVPFYYRDIEIRQLAVTLVVVTIGLFVYQRYREESEYQALDSREKLHANMHQTAALSVRMDKAKGEFVALASHQLRTPISGIRWSTEMLLNGDAGQLSDDQLDYVKGIEQSNNRLGRIVDAMLLVSSLDLGNVTITTEPVNLPKMSRKVIKSQLDEMPDKQLEVVEDYEHALPKLELDTHVMTIILQNVLSNAVRYTPAGGKVTVKIALSDEKISKKSKGSVLVGVTDTGYGIPSDQQKDVFNKMFRAANIKARDTEGSGLGLYIAKALVERSGGRIWFESEENKGTAFYILLPLEGMRGVRPGRR